MFGSVQVQGVRVTDEKTFVVREFQLSRKKWISLVRARVALDQLVWGIT